MDHDIYISEKEILKYLAEQNYSNEVFNNIPIIKIGERLFSKKEIVFNYVKTNGVKTVSNA